MGFAPRLTPDNFKCAFTAAEGWGSFTQTRAGDTITATLRVNWGKLELRKLALAVPAGTAVQKAQATLGASRVEARLINGLARVEIEFAGGVKIAPERPLTVTLSGL
jgi:hypothetical protein